MHIFANSYTLKWSKDDQEVQLILNTLWRNLAFF